MAQGYDVQSKIFHVLFGILLMFGVKSKAAVDVHTHFISPQFLRDFPYMKDFPVGSAELRKQMVQNKIQVAFVLSNAYHYYWLESGDKRKAVEAENNYILAETRKYPKNLIPFCSVIFQEPWAVEEIVRCHRLGSYGIKLHLENNEVNISTPQMRAQYALILEKTKRLGMPLFIHANVETRQQFVDTVARGATSGGKIIFAHFMAGSWRFWQELLTPGNLSLKNVYVDLSTLLNRFKNAPLALRQELAWTMRIIGVDHILFGSDFPVESISQSIQSYIPFQRKNLSRYGFTDQELDGIFSKNYLTFIQPISTRRNYSGARF